MKRKDNVKKSIIIKNVSFKYQSTNIFENLSFKLGVNEHIGLVGGSGTGKSTLLRLMAMILQPSEGEIEYRNAGNIIYVPQDGYLYTGTIMHNLNIAKDSYNVTKEELSLLSDKICLQFIQSLDKKWDTEIVNGGLNLSGGQKQRIMLAMAMLRAPDVLLLDETTSALDKKTELTVINNIMRMMINKSVVLSTHNKSLLKYVDKIYEFHSGGGFYEKKSTEHRIS